MAFGNHLTVDEVSMLHSFLSIWRDERSVLRLIAGRCCWLIISLFILSLGGNRFCDVFLRHLEQMDFAACLSHLACSGASYDSLAAVLPRLAGR